MDTVQLNIPQLASFQPDMVCFVICGSLPANSAVYILLWSTHWQAFNLLWKYQNWDQIQKWFLTKIKNFGQLLLSASRDLVKFICDSVVHKDRKMVKLKKQCRWVFQFHLAYVPSPLCKITTEWSINNLKSRSIFSFVEEMEMILPKQSR